MKIGKTKNVNICIYCRNQHVNFMYILSEDIDVLNLL